MIKIRPFLPLSVCIKDNNYYAILLIMCIKFLCFFLCMSLNLLYLYIPHPHQVLLSFEKIAIARRANLFISNDKEKLHNVCHMT